jgi:hypothetical protein
MAIMMSALRTGPACAGIHSFGVYAMATRIASIALRYRARHSSALGGRSHSLVPMERAAQASGAVGGR